MSVLSSILTILLVIDCLALIGIILLQKGRGEGLASALGGLGGDTAFGTRAATLAQKATAVMFVLFLLLSVLLGVVVRRAQLRETGASLPTTSEPAPPPAPGPPMTD